MLGTSGFQELYPSVISTRSQKTIIVYIFYYWPNYLRTMLRQHIESRY